MNIETVGKVTEKIGVEISYRIIELFSAGLYSSPNKSFEELISNSYDAFADKVSVFVPDDLKKEGAFIWVCDNGESMDIDGFKELWKIGESNKRTKEREKKRLQIGRFGIGKLSTYILARKLTHICRKGKKYYAISMDYSTLNTSATEAEKIFLDARLLSLDEVKEILSPLIFINDKPLLNFNLWGKNAEKSWTFAIMTDLKAKASEISMGRLTWILKTALPLSPKFKLYFNGENLVSSKINKKVVKEWVMGTKSDEIVKKFNKDYEITTLHNKPAINLKSLKKVTGKFILYEESLVTGKSEKLGRSHGIFLMVRGRLINNDDPLLGLDALTHGAFNRTQIIINADGLDDHLTSTRESIKESDALAQLREYVKRKFNNELRPFYFEYQENQGKKHKAAYKISTTPTGLTRRPLLILARKFFKGEISEPLLTILPSSLSKKEQGDFLTKLEEDLTSDNGIIKDVNWEILEPDDPIALLDLQNRNAKINLMHPFFANFSEDLKSTLPFQLIALVEILTEAHLFELGIDQEDIRIIMERRDHILRELTFSDKPNAPVVATMIKDSLADSTGFEDALYSAFNSLGFETTKLGGSGKPDGIATAFLGFSKDSDDLKFSLVYDAKSTTKGKIKAGTAKISTSVRHRTDFKAKFSLVIARDFEGADNNESAVSKEARQNKVTLIRASDFIRLILLAAPKQLGLDDLRNLFETCYTVNETKEWIDKLESKTVRKGPIKELIETIYDLQKKDTEPPEIASIRMSQPELKSLSKQELIKLVQSLETLVPRFIHLENETVSIQAKPENIFKAINNSTTTDIPPEFKAAYLKAFKI